MHGGNPRLKEHRADRWVAKALVLSVFACLLVALFPGTAGAAWPTPVQVGSAATGTNPWSACAQGGYAYVVNYGSNTLHVFDVSDPTAPTQVGSAATGAYPRSVCVQGGYAYVVNEGSDSLQVFDVSDPASIPPAVCSAVTDNYPYSVCVQGGYAYVVNGSDSLQVFDVSDPTSSPPAVGSAVTGGSPLSVCVQGGYAYVVNFTGNNLQVFNVSNPASPTLSGQIGTLIWPTSVCVQGGYAYVADSGHGALRVFDVSDPAAPTPLGAADTEGSPTSVCVQGGYAYVVNGGSETLQVFDVSDPDSPSTIGSAETDILPYSVCVQNGYAYVVNCNSSTLQVFNLTNPPAPTQVGFADTGTEPVSVCAQGGYAYVVNYISRTLQIFDVSDPASPDPVGTVGTGSGPKSVCVQGGYAYVANYDGRTLQVFDVSNPASPVPVGSLATVGQPDSVHVQGGYAYVVNIDGPWFLQVFDVSDPASPVPVGSVATGSYPQSVYVQGGYAYVTNWDHMLEVFDVSDPAAPVFSGSVGTEGLYPTSGCVQGGYAYLVNVNSHTLKVFDVSNPASPALVGSAYTGDYTNPMSVCVQGGHAYVVTYQGCMLEVFDVSDPASPTLTSSVGTGGAWPYSVCVQGGYAYVVNYRASNTLTVFDLATTYGVSVTPPTDAESGNPNTSVSYTLNVANTGNTADTFNSSVSGSPAWTTTVDTPTLNLAAGANQDVTVNVDIPAGAAGGATDEATVTYTSAGDGTKSNSSDLTTTANNVYGVSVTPPTDAKSANPGTTVTYALTVTNKGSTADTFTPGIGGSPAWTIKAPTVDNLAAGASRDVSVTVDIPAEAAGGATDEATVTYTSAGDETRSDSSQLDTTANNLVGTTWYLAEGSNAWGFSTYITLENPNDSAVNARLTYMAPNAPASGKGIVGTRTVTLPPLSQTTVSSEPDIGPVDFSTKVESLEGKTIAVDRTMFWTGEGSSSPGYHSSIGTDTPSRSWYLPEGSSKWGFETWTLVQNPNNEDATVTLIYMAEDNWQKVLARNVPANGRIAYSMAADIGEHDSSVEVTSDLPVIAERSMYRNNHREGSCSIGATTPAADYFLAEGACGYDVGFTTYVLVQNPQDSTNDVTLTYQTASGPVAGPTFTMEPNTRKTVKVNDNLPTDSDVSTLVHGSKPLIAERAIYWDNGTGEAFHASVGLSAPHTTFMLPDGQTSGGFETWTLIANPNPGAVTVRITYLPQNGGTPVTFTDGIPSNIRATYNMADKFPSGRASILVQSLDGARPIMVERAMYMNNRGGGTDTIGGFSD
ncbi:MAG: hypothetical protein V1748_09245 [Actinomycetota bacterium]